MTRLIRGRRIGGSGSEPLRCRTGRAVAMALAATFAVLVIVGVSSFGPIGVVFAQTAGTARQSLFNCSTATPSKRMPTVLRSLPLPSVDGTGPADTARAITH